MSNGRPTDCPMDIITQEIFNMIIHVHQVQCTQYHWTSIRLIVLDPVDFITKLFSNIVIQGLLPNGHIRTNGHIGINGLTGSTMGPIYQFYTLDPYPIGYSKLFNIHIKSIGQYVHNLSIGSNVFIRSNVSTGSKVASFSIEPSMSLGFSVSVGSNLSIGYNVPIGSNVPIVSRAHWVRAFTWSNGHNNDIESLNVPIGCNVFNGPGVFSVQNTPNHLVCKDVR